MPSSKEYLDFLLDQLSSLEGISFKSMMGEYILYINGRIFGGVYDDRLLVKPVNSAIKALGEGAYQLPYEGAKPMLLVDNVDDKEYLQKLITDMYAELPEKKSRKR